MHLVAGLAALVAPVVSALAPPIAAQDADPPAPGHAAPSVADRTPIAAPGAGVGGRAAGRRWSWEDPERVAALPELVVRADDTRVERSCRLVVPEGLVLEDVAGDGVVQVVADDVLVVVDDGSVLRGGPPGADPDTARGVGVVVTGQGVSLSGLRLAGFATGVLAEGADGLLLEDCEVLSGFAQRLRSTAELADDGADWLRPHDNDQDEWRHRYGAAFWIADSRSLTVRGCRARRVQNGLVLSRVEEALVHDNDFSFLSGWGLALWRSSRNQIERNALDLCVRGLSPGVYNRGQDSAGLLLFEQCHANRIARNSMTHGGDGVFAFAGREALGETGELPGGHAGLGHHGNAFLDNDLSFAAAHGLELTFSGPDLIEGNLFEDNAICGVWGGYSSDLLIRANRFLGNGERGYGLERGGVNIEHGRRNHITGNLFVDNECGVHLWWDEDSHLAALPWALDEGAGPYGLLSADNVVMSNRFDGGDVGVHLRSTTGTFLRGNSYIRVGDDVLREGKPPVDPDGRDELDLEDIPDEEPVMGYPDFWVGLHHRAPDGWREPDYVDLPAGPVPVGARPALRAEGRAAVRMTPWGPWDHGAPAWSVLSRGTAEQVFELLGATARQRETLASLPAGFLGPGTVASLGTRAGEPHEALSDPAATLRVAPAAGVEGPVPWRLDVPGLPPLEGEFLAAQWSVQLFPTPFDPREDLAAFQAAIHTGVAVELPELQLLFGSGGPSELGFHAALTEAGLPTDHFGTRAETRVPLPAGRRRLVSESDDGLRVRVDGELLVDDWTWHAPRRHEVEFTLDEAREVHIEVEHFELDGWSVLRIDLERVEP